MDQRDDMTFSGSSSFYMQQRGITVSVSGTHSGLQGSPGFCPQSNTNVQYPSTIGATVVSSTLPVESPSGVSSHGGNLGTPSMLLGETVKRKRGRPRKYGPDGAVSLALTPSKATHSIAISPTQKRVRGRPLGSGRKQQLASLGEWLSGSDGMGFTPHVITIAIGEDIATKIKAFARQGPRAVCILSANGAVSTVTLRQPSSSGGSVTYEGQFEILCLSSSYLLTGNGGSCDQTGGLTVSLANPNGHVIGGGVEGMLTAASHVQVIAGSFAWGGSKIKNRKGEVRPVEDSVQQSGDSDATGTQPSPNPTSISPVGIWPGSRPMDMHNSHLDIDLMRG